MSSDTRERILKNLQESSSDDETDISVTDSNDSRVLRGGKKSLLSSSPPKTKKAASTSRKPPSSTSSQASSSSSHEMNKKSDTDDEQDECQQGEYVVEKILDKRINTATDKKEYLIKWAGWAKKYNSWEPKENLSCPELLAEFEKNHKSSEATSKPSTSNGSAKRPSQSGGPSSKKTRKSGPKAGPARAKLNRKARGKNYNENNESSETDDDPDDDPDGLTGFERGLMPHRIVGVMPVHGERKFLIEWHGCRFADVISVDEVNERYPQLVIDFYENLVFKQMEQENGV